MISSLKIYTRVPDDYTQAIIQPMRMILRRRSWLNTKLDCANLVKHTSKSSGGICTSTETEDADVISCSIYKSASIRWSIGLQI